MSQDSESQYEGDLTAEDLSVAPAVKVHPSFLHSNSTSHIWVFGAFAELIDNVHDLAGGATSLAIDAIKPDDRLGWMVTFTDDGPGLSEEQLMNMLSFGYTEKHRHAGSGPVGRYGNGFKSASMRIGKDALVLTKCPKSNTMSVGFLSQTLHEKLEAETIHVPIVTWSIDTKQRISDESKNLELILAYSMFDSEQSIVDEFKERIKCKGTRIIISKLKVKKDGKLELDLESDKNDIINSQSMEIDGVHRAEPQIIPKYRRSLKEYCSILYLKTQLKIRVCGKPVSRVEIANSLENKSTIQYKPKFNANLLKPLEIVYGLARPGKDYGIVLYWKNRLIKAYKKIGSQSVKDKGSSSVTHRVVGVVDVGDFLNTVHNKQDFDKDDRYNACMNAFKIKMNQYCKEITKDDKSTESDESQEEADEWAKCDKCGKLRRLPVGQTLEELPEHWECSMNEDTRFNRCDAVEEKRTLAERRAMANKYRQTPKSQKGTGKSNLDPDSSKKPRTDDDIEGKPKGGEPRRALFTDDDSTAAEAASTTAQESPQTELEVPADGVHESVDEDRSNDESCPTDPERTQVNGDASGEHPTVAYDPQMTDLAAPEIGIETDNLVSSAEDEEPLDLSDMAVADAAIASVATQEDDDNRSEISQEQEGHEMAEDQNTSEEPLVSQNVTEISSTMAVCQANINTDTASSPVVENPNARDEENCIPHIPIENTVPNTASAPTAVEDQTTGRQLRPRSKIGLNKTQSSGLNQVEIQKSQKPKRKAVRAGDDDADGVEEECNEPYELPTAPRHSKCRRAASPRDQITTIVESATRPCSASCLLTSVGLATVEHGRLCSSLDVDNVTTHRAECEHLTESETAAKLNELRTGVRIILQKHYPGLEIGEDTEVDDHVKRISKEIREEEHHD